MQTTETYNGWTNYATWNVKLWLDNDSHTHFDIMAATADKLDEEFAVARVAEFIEDYVDDMRHADLEDKAEQASMFADLLNHTLANVNWREIAEAYIQDTKEEQAKS